MEYALGIDAGFWMNLQVLYDKEMIDFMEQKGSMLVWRQIESGLPEIKSFIFKAPIEIQNGLSALYEGIKESIFYFIE